MIITDNDNDEVLTDNDEVLTDNDEVLTLDASRGTSKEDGISWMGEYGNMEFAIGDCSKFLIAACALAQTGFVHPFNEAEAATFLF